MKKLLIVTGIAMIFIAIWQCDAVPRRHKDGDQDHDRNNSERVKVVLRINKDGKIIVGNIPVWKLKNMTREQLVVSTDESGNPIINLNGEIREIQRNRTFKGKIRKRRNHTSSSSSFSPVFVVDNPEDFGEDGDDDGEDFED